MRYREVERDAEGESFTQLICESQGYCLCVGEPNAWDECCCIAADDSALDSVCRHCNQEMVRIEFSTGERVQ